MAVHSFKRARQALVLACGVVCAGAHAQSDALASASAALSNVRFDLVSLAPQSGVAPSIQFGLPSADGGLTSSQAWVNASGQTYRDASGSYVTPYKQGAYFNAPLPTQPLQVVSTDGFTSVSANQSGMSASLTLTQDFKPPAGSRTNELGVGGAAGSGSSLSNPSMDTDLLSGHLIVRPDSGFAQPVDFTLSAHTTLTLSADASVALAPGQNINQVFGGSSAYLSGVAGISLGRSTPLQPLQGEYRSWFEYVNDLHAAYAWQSASVSMEQSLDPGATKTDSRHLSLTLVNDSDQAITGVFTLNVSTYANLYMLQPNGAVVPEPATCLMMGLGLVSLGWRRRTGRARV